MEKHVWHGYMGKLLRVDLTAGKYSVEELDPVEMRKYMGGTGYAAKLLYQEMPGGVDPLSPEAKVVFSTGPLTGTLCPSGGSYEVCYKSPLTGTWCQARSGGSFGPKLKFAGFDFLVLEGKAAEWVCLHIVDGHVEIRKAAHLLGLDVEAATDRLQDEIDDPEASVAAIGQAGENGVLYACLMNDRGRAAGRGGIGAVLGAKQVKAIVVNGTGGIAPAKVDEFITAVEQAEENIKKYPFAAIPLMGTMCLLSQLNGGGMLPTRNFQTGNFESADKLSDEKLDRNYQIKRRGCFGCSFACGRYTSVKSGPFATPPMEGPEYETADMFGAMCSVSDLEAIIRANYLCNIYGLDTISTGNSIAFAMECFEKGILTVDDTEGVELRFGNTEAVIATIDKIVKQEGIGKLLSKGVKKAAEELGRGAEDMAMHVKGMELPGHEPRAESKILGLQYAVSSRGACHMHPNWSSTWEFQLDCGMNEFGQPWPPLEVPNESKTKGTAYRYVALQGEISEILGTCIFYSWGVEGICITPKLYAELLSSLTGWDVSPAELVTAAERSLNLKRCFAAREGFTRKEDRLPKRLYTEIPNGPSKGGKITSIEDMLDGYYEAMQWDLGTGLPTVAKLEQLDLGFAGV
ncbi:MAG: aldehyde ferredoxin oxidoreductase family protein [Syntrophobacter sp.]